MRKLLPLLVLLPTLALGDGMYVVRRAPAAAGTANVLNETFEGGTYSDGDWNLVCSVDCGTIDPNETTSCGSGTGWSGDCLEITDSTFQASWTSNLFAAQTGNLWLRARVKFSVTGFEVGDRAIIAQFSDATPTQESNDSVYMRIIEEAGPVTNLYLIHGGSQSGVTATAITTGNQYCLEMFMNNTSNAWEVWVDGVSKGSGTDANIIMDPVRLVLGSDHGQGDETVSMYFDQVQVSNDARLPCD